MAKAISHDENFDDEDGSKSYKKSLRALQIELVKLQKHIIANNLRLLVIFEGRDAAGKDGTIKRIVEHLSPRETRVVALGKPSDRETSQWYFQRYTPYLPASDEFVLFNRSWYNRAGVERVMGFCTDTQYEAFMEAVCPFEEMLVRDGILLFKYYLDISRDEQRERLADRKSDPLKQWKISPIDGAAIAHWDEYSNARNEMLIRTNHKSAPWHIVIANDKKRTRLNVIRDLLSRIAYDGRKTRLLKPDARVVFPFAPEKLTSKHVAP